MLLVPTFLATSPGRGIGLFAAEPIAAGTPIWALDLRIDRLISDDELRALPGPVRTAIERWAYRQGDCWVVCADGGQFANHDDDPNMVPLPGDDVTYTDVAARDIAAGEELTCNYRLFDDEAVQKIGPAPGQ